MKLVCIFTQSITPNQINAASAPTTGVSSFCATGASMGTMMKAISKKSRKKARKKTSRLTAIRKPQTPPGRLVSPCSTQRLPSTPAKTMEKQVAPTTMKATMEVMRMVARMPSTIKSCRGLSCQARQQSQMTDAKNTEKLMRNGTVFMPTV